MEVFAGLTPSFCAVLQGRHDVTQYLLQIAPVLLPAPFLPLHSRVGFDNPRAAQSVRPWDCGEGFEAQAMLLLARNILPLCLP